VYQIDALCQLVQVSFGKLDCSGVFHRKSLSNQNDTLQLTSIYYQGKKKSRDSLGLQQAIKLSVTSLANVLVKLCAQLLHK
jgi:hypothetical protein